MIGKRGGDMFTGENLAKAIEKAIIAKGVSKAELARELKVTAQAVNGWVRSGNIGKEKIFDLMEYFSDTVSPEHWGLDVDSFSELDADTILISQYKTGGRGGSGLVMREQPGIIKQWQVSKDWLHSNIPYYTSIENLCIITGFGDSMPDTFNSGDPILIDTGVKTCDHDGVFFFRIGDEGYVKRLQRIPGIGIRVLSQNREYEAWTISEEMDFEVLGKVLKVWKGKNF